MEHKHLTIWDLGLRFGPIHTLPWTEIAFGCVFHLAMRNRKFRSRNSSLRPRWQSKWGKHEERSNQNSVEVPKFLILNS
jgi:hypothetical protein